MVIVSNKFPYCCTHANLVRDKPSSYKYSRRSPTVSVSAAIDQNELYLSLDLELELDIDRGWGG